MSQPQIHDHLWLGLTDGSQRTSDASGLSASSLEVADYIADMSLLLHKLAVSATLTNVALQLEMAYYAAFAAAHPPVPSDAAAEK